ncbi:hypothetical protein GCM10027020_25890 [Nocardioides salsibiostraticola]
MIISASTVKDTLPNVQRFVAGNLAGGIDHLVVFLDAGDSDCPGVRSWLEEQTHVTCIRTDKSWWHGERPAELNVRQRINANVIKAVASTVESVEWVFHLDADEVAQIDRGVLASVPDETQVVTLAPLEAVSRQYWDGDPTWFKRKLSKAELTLLETLGVIDRAHNGAYFHGHVDGKSGVRPGTDRWLTLHHGVDAQGEELPTFKDPALSLLHYESYSGEDFVRKWTSILSAGPMANFRPGREPTAVALRALIGLGLSAEEAAPFFRRIFERTTEDDFETLRDLRLLVEVDPLQGSHEPAPWPGDDEQRFADALAAIAGVSKRPFHPGTPAAEVDKILAEAGTGAGIARVKAGRSFLRRS